MYRPGDITAITLHGLPGLGRWEMPATALILAADPDDMLIYAYQLILGASLYARGPLSTALDGAHATLHQPITTGPHPDGIQLGDVIDRIDPSTALDDLIQRAHAALAPHWTARGNGPLGTDALPALDIAIANVASCRDGATAAERHRDQLVQRFINGGLGPTALGRPGLSTSRVSQIGKQRERNASMATQETTRAG